VTLDVRGGRLDPTSISSEAAPSRRSAYDEAAPFYTLRHQDRHTAPKYRLANARPEPDFRYLSKRAAAGNSIETSTRQGRRRRV
jgi:hypothetical protein